MPSTEVSDVILPAIKGLIDRTAKAESDLATASDALKAAQADLATAQADLAKAGETIDALKAAQAEDFTAIEGALKPAPVSPAPIA